MKPTQRYLRFALPGCDSGPNSIEFLLRRPPMLDEEREDQRQRVLNIHCQVRCFGAIEKKTLLKTGKICLSTFQKVDVVLEVHNLTNKVVFPNP